MRWLVALLIRVLPAEVRHDRAGDIAATFRATIAAARRRGRAAAARACLAESANLIGAAFAGRLAPQRVSDALRPGDPPREKYMSILQDIRFAGRALAARPAFVAVTVLTLALALGATTTIFSVVDALIWRPPPFTGADRMVEIWTQAERSKISNPGISVAAIQALRQQRSIFERVEAHDFGSGILLGGSEPDRISVVAVTPTLLQRLGVIPMRGRLFDPADARPDAERSVVISESLWRSHFGGDPEILGRSVELDGDGKYTIVGVLPSTFRFPSDRTRAWRPMQVETLPSSRRLEAIAWLQPGTTIERAGDAVGGFDARLREDGALPSARRLKLNDLRQQRFGISERRGLLVVFGAVGLVLLVACANVAGLLLAQGAARQRDIAVSAALGAGRARLVRQFLFEALALGAMAGAIGCLLAWLLVDTLAATIPRAMTFLTARAIVVDGRVLGFAAALSMLTTVLFGVLPALRASRPELSDVLKSGSRGVSASRAHRRLRAGILVVELALAVVLLTGSGLLTRSFLRLQQVDPGFDPRSLVSFSVEIPKSRYGSAESVAAFTRRLEEQLEAMPSVAAASVATSLPPDADFLFGTEPEAENRPKQDPGPLGIVPYASVASDYFATLGIPLRKGRTFAPSDPTDVVIINETAARRYWAGEEPLLRRFRTGPKARWLTVIGVAQDVQPMGPRAPADSGIQLYYPLHAAGETRFREFVLRSPLVSASLLADVKAQVWSLDPRLPVESLAPVGEDIAAKIEAERFYLLLMTLFAVLGVAISAVGIYGLMAYTVELRRQEIGIRMALGADRRTIVSSVLGGAAGLAAAGLVLGVPGALAGTRVLQSLLYETSTRDLATLVSVAAVLTVVTLTAAWIPARRAARLDPLAVLRTE